MVKARKKVFVMISGGVDSSVAAALLKTQGFLVTGMFMKNWGGESEYCTTLQDEADARRVAAKLNIPFYVLNFEKEYKQLVFDPFIESLKEGNTPNPDVFCNEFIKFGVFLNTALALGADMVATGHYARIKKDYMLHATSYKLMKAKDERKDQTYFLYRLNQFQLSKMIFPLGDFTKQEARLMAKEFGLPTFQKPDSQGICFVGEEPFSKFVARYVPKKLGTITDKKGDSLGNHQGVALYTIGQRKGLGIGGLKEPLFIAAKDPRKNVLIAVGQNDELLYTKSVKLTNVHWISSKTPIFPFRCKARIRYRQELQSCSIERSKKQEVRFSVAQRAITPGQALVFYQRNEVLGGGTIR